VRALFGAMQRSDLVATLEEIGLPFAPIARPDDLFDDPHLNAAGGLLDVTIPGGAATRLPALPLEFDGERPGLQHDIPTIGRDGDAILRDLGFDDAEIAALTTPA
jgi:crotonobetainyl-CoA:carnitine CoA-transferase CaiB-like acyl-CoA transferase